MTRHDELLLGVLLGALGDGTSRQAAVRLLELGLADRRACEALAVRAEVERLCREGVSRCGAMLLTAEKFCCSYEKVRGIFYNK